MFTFYLHLHTHTHTFCLCAFMYGCTDMFLCFEKKLGRADTIPFNQAVCCQPTTGKFQVSNMGNLHVFQWYTIFFCLFVFFSIEIHYKLLVKFVKNKNPLCKTMS